MILVFRTNVAGGADADHLKPLLDGGLQDSTWNFNLEDCDRILRVEGRGELAARVIRLLPENGFNCEELSD